MSGDDRSYERLHKLEAFAERMAGTHEGDTAAELARQLRRRLWQKTKSDLPKDDDVAVEPWEDQVDVFLAAAMEIGGAHIPEGWSETVQEGTSIVRDMTETVRKGRRAVGTVKKLAALVKGSIRAGKGS